MIEDENQFINGFNTGYLLAKYEPKIIASILLNLQPITSYLSGMIMGQREFELWQAKIILSELGSKRRKTIDDRDRNLD